MPKTNDDKAEYLANEEVRQDKKSCIPTDNEHPDRFITGLKKYSDAGKGDNYRNIPGWYGDEITERLNRIFKKDAKKTTHKKENDKKA